MRKFLIFLSSLILVVPQAAHALISDGANAVDLLGQYEEDLSDPQPFYTKGGVNNGPNKFGFAFSPQSSPDAGSMVLDATNDRFFVSDSENNRILVYNLNGDDTFPDRIPDNVLGQSDFLSNASATTQSGLNRPTGLAYDAGTDSLYVADNDNNRVLIFNVAAITNGENAVNVLGQEDFDSSGFALTRDGMNSPSDVDFDSDNNLLYVADTSNSRVTVFDVAAPVDGQDAANVLGQANFTTVMSSGQQGRMFFPRGVLIDAANDRLFVADTNNNRVTVFAVDVITDGENAANVLGQPNFMGGSTTPGTTQAKLNNPQSLEYDAANDILYVADGNNNRVTTYDVAVVADGENAVNVLGQENFTSSTAATDQDGLSFPRGLAFDATNSRLLVGDDTNNRVMIFDVAAITDGEDAVDALGQTDSDFADPQPVYTKSGANDGPNTLGLSIGLSVGAGIDIDTVNHRLFVADPTNSRVLIYELADDNTFDDKFPDNVLGQDDFFSSATDTTQDRFFSINGLAYDQENERLFVADSFNNRVMIFDVAAVSDGEDAVNVLGQDDFVSGSSATTQDGMDSPLAVAYDSENERLFVAESGNDRVVIFDVAEITDGEDAINVLGQADFTLGDPETSAAGMNAPNSLIYDASNERLFVSQASDSRVTVYDVSEITDGEDAVNVLGQPDFETSDINDTQEGMNVVQGLAYDWITERLFVSQYGNNRVTVYDAKEIVDGEGAVNVLGQDDFVSTGAATTQDGFNVPTHMLYDLSTRRLFVSDSSNNRVMIFDASAAEIYLVESADATAVTEGGATDSFELSLTSEPATDVVLNLVSDDVAISLSVPSLTFTNGNWDTPQTVTVSSVADDNTVSETPTITISVDDAASDDDWDDVEDQTVDVSVTDTTVPEDEDDEDEGSGGGGGGGGGAISILLNGIVNDVINGEDDDEEDDQENEEPIDEPSDLPENPPTQEPPQNPTQPPVRPIPPYIPPQRYIPPRQPVIIPGDTDTDEEVEETDDEETAGVPASREDVRAIVEFIVENALVQPTEIEAPELSPEAETITETFEILATTEAPEVVEQTTDLVVEVIAEVVSATDLDEVLVEIEGSFVDIAGGDFTFALSEREAEKKRVENPSIGVLTPSTTTPDGMGILFAVMNDIDPFETDANDNGIPNMDEIFVHSLPHTQMAVDLAEKTKNGGIVTNLHSFYSMPVLFLNDSEKNRLSVNVFGEDGPYEAVIVKVEEENEFIEIERGEGEIEENKAIYEVQNYLEDGKYFILISRTDQENPKIYVSEFEVLENDILKTSELEMETLEVLTEDQEEQVFVLTGNVNKPGMIVFVSFESIIFNSVVISDANGDFRVTVPNSIGEGEHEAVVYAYEEDFEARRAILSNISRLFFRK